MVCVPQISLSPITSRLKLTIISGFTIRYQCVIPSFDLLPSFRNL